MPWSHKLCDKSEKVSLMRKQKYQAIQVLYCLVHFVHFLKIFQNYGNWNEFSGAVQMFCDVLFQLMKESYGNWSTNKQQSPAYNSIWHKMNLYERLHWPKGCYCWGVYFLTPQIHRADGVPSMIYENMLLF